MTSTSPTHIESATTYDEVWTARRAVRANSAAVRAVAAIAAIATLASTMHPDIPVAAGITVVMLLPAVLVDVVVRRLPDRLVAGAAIIGLATAAVARVSGAEISVVDGIVGGVVMSLPLLVAHLVSPKSMGFGDVKFGLVLGAAVGLVDPMAAVATLALGSLGASLHGLVTRQRSVAFGPGLLAGAVVMLVFLALDPFGSSDVQSLISLGRSNRP